MVSRLTSLINLEKQIGVPGIALSFASDAEAEASTISEFCKFYSVSYYHYLERVYSQSGIDIYDAMRFIYTKTRNVIILNSPMYRKSEATIFEYYCIAQEVNKKNIMIIDTGGDIIDFWGKYTPEFKTYSSENIINFILSARIF